MSGPSVALAALASSVDSLEESIRSFLKISSGLVPRTSSASSFESISMQGGSGIEMSFLDDSLSDVSFSIFAVFRDATVSSSFCSIVATTLFVRMFCSPRSLLGTTQLSLTDLLIIEE